MAEDSASLLRAPTGDEGVEMRAAPQLGQRSTIAATVAAVALLGFFALIALAGQHKQESAFLPRALGDEQHVYIIRHGDKYSSYPNCPAPDGGLCFDEELMGDNPPLTHCGSKQASQTAGWLSEQKSKTGDIENIVVSPYTRTLQTALPFAESIGKKLHVEHLLSEANQPEGPFREFNIDNSPEVVSQIEEVHKIWDLDYSSIPIRTPENYTLYNARVKTAAEVLKKRFPPSSGNLAVFTHATTAFSIAYGLCHGDEGSDKLEDFVKGQDAIGPAGVIHVILGADGSCKSIKQTENVAEEGCGDTPPYKCAFEDFPSWYWSHPQGKGPGKCH